MGDPVWLVLAAILFFAYVLVVFMAETMEKLESIEKIIRNIKND